MPAALLLLASAPSQPHAAELAAPATASPAWWSRLLRRQQPPPPPPPPNWDGGRLLGLLQGALLVVQSALLCRMCVMVRSIDRKALLAAAAGSTDSRPEAKPPSRLSLPAQIEAGEPLAALLLDHAAPLAALREAYEAAGGEPDAYLDPFLLRFLSGARGDAARACEWVRGAVRWREESGASSLRRGLLRGGKVTSRQSLSRVLLL